jgi:hypothetical protein
MTPRADRKRQLGALGYQLQHFEHAAAGKSDTDRLEADQK